MSVATRFLKFAVLLQSLKSVNPERAAKLYNCVFCPGGSASFKWQSELYKHCVFKHFQEDLVKELGTALTDAKASTVSNQPLLQKNNLQQFTVRTIYLKMLVFKFGSR